MALERSTRELVVILHADVMGSTRLVQRNETLAHIRIRDAFQHFAETIRSYGGTVREVRGDALLATFHRASDAVYAALSFQAGNTHYNETLDDYIRPEVRIGIALGEVIIADGTLTGPDVVVAQRVEQLADPGAICIQGTAYDTIPRRLRTECTNLGDQTVSGFDEPVRVYAVEPKPADAIPPPEARQLPEFSPTRRFTLGAVLTLLLVAGGATAWLQPWKRDMAPADSSSIAYPLPDRPSIAVLPFENMSNDKQQEYFADGVTEDIITNLATVSNLVVIAHHSTRKFKGANPSIREVAHDLGVRYVLKGSVRRSRSTLRITAQLIDALNGSHIWAQSYDRKLEDIFPLQDEITAEIGSRLVSKVVAAEFEHRTRRGTREPEAYDLFLRGWEAIQTLNPRTNSRAIKWFEEATERDPEFARAHAYLALTIGFNASFLWAREPRDNFNHAIVVAHKAVSLDPDDALTHRVLGHLHRMQGEYENAIEALEIALSLGPSDPDTMIALAFAFAFSGRGEEAVRHAIGAIRLNPHAPFFYAQFAGIAYYMNKQFDKAAVAFDQARQLNPTFDDNIHWLAASYAQLGRLEEAHEARDELLRRRPTFSIEGHLSQYRAQGEVRELIVEGYRKAGFSEKAL